MKLIIKIVSYLFRTGRRITGDRHQVSASRQHGASPRVLRSEQQHRFIIYHFRTQTITFISYTISRKYPFQVKLLNFYTRSGLIFSVCIILYPLWYKYFTSIDKVPVRV